MGTRERLTSILERIITQTAKSKRNLSPTDFCLFLNAIARTMGAIDGGADKEVLRAFKQLKEKAAPFQATKRDRRNDIFQRRVRELCKARGINKAKLARRARVSQNALYPHYRAQLSSSQIEKVAKALGVAVGELCS